MAQKLFGSAQIGVALAGVIVLTGLAACSDGGAATAPRQQAAATTLPGYACSRSTGAPSEMVCTRRSALQASAAGPDGPPARFGAVSRSAAVATYPRNAPAPRARALPLSGRVGVILPRLDQRGRGAAASMPTPGQQLSPPAHPGPAHDMPPATSNSS